MDLSLKAYRDKVGLQRCRWCQAILPGAIQHYPHPDGWPITGLEGLHWLYIRCRKCGYEWSLWKLGVPRDWAPT